MNKALAALLLHVGLASAALAQNQTNPTINGNTAAYNSSQPSCTSGQWCTMQTDINGNLRVVGPSGGLPIIGTVNQGTPNAGGVLAWPVSDVVAETSLATIATNSGSSIPAGSNLIGNVNGPIASGQTGASTNPFRIGYQVRTTNVSTKTNGVIADSISTAVGALIQKPFSIPELDWAFASASGGISNTTTAVTMIASAGAGVKNYLTSCQISSDTLGAATEVAIRDGAGGSVLWRTKIATAGLLSGENVLFQSPLKGTAATLMEIVTLTATITGGVYVNCQGYQAP